VPWVVALALLAGAPVSAGPFACDTAGETDCDGVPDSADNCILLSQRIEEKNVQILTSTFLPVLNVIPFQIQQLFNNLLSNSIKYSKPNVAPVISINSRMVSAKGLPLLMGNPKSRYYKMSFSDNGIGFDPKHSDDIYKLFYRLHSKTDFSGTGVGLAICKVIVENHKGFIKAESTPNEGTTISFYLPA
jgi:light-regulated signal transduction histidine kinase (bacteriophytochrome)